ncbi:PREDICTED: rhomboid-related protein 2-like isoform X2 [Priapulus caudatus]|uniref:Rhomboid-related protein 2-like isoform X2 n=1 Tax=Priapulus caudatus TaxID=37621 RepID=A0ABM1DQV9_PRICU|nr:PREDICTED: rhomboid-related protein 2-like isoform X2 [Priapulus caudatus]
MELPTLEAQPNESQWKRLFDEYDADHDGYIPLAEFRNIMIDKAHTHDLPRSKHDDIIMRADKDNDGRISQQEFVNIMMNPDPRLNVFQWLVEKGVESVVPRTSTTTVKHYVQQYNCIPPPLFMILISVAEIIIFIYYCVEAGYVGANGPVPVHSIFIYNPHKRKEAWRYATYMFIHAGALHIVFNLIIQIVLGVPLELVHKWWRIMFVYICGVIAGSLGTSVVDSYVYLAGASGGVYAVLSAHLANVIMNWSEMEFGWARLLFVIILAASDIATALYYRYTGVETGVGYAAHFCGALAGVLVGIVTLKNIDVRPWEEKVWWISLSVFLAAVMFAVFWNIFYCGFPADSLSGFCRD